MRRRLILALMPWWLASACLADEALQLDELLQSSLQHFPQILAAEEQVNASAGRVLASEGAFDLQLEQKSQTRATGYYDGSVIDSRVVKPLPDFNTRLYGGYRIADGEFPIYEDEYRTNGGGEFKVGAIFSLLKDRDIDERRHALRDRRLALSQSALEARLIQLSVQHRAMRAYLGWLAGGRALEVHRDLLALAETRQAGLASRVEDGDLAAVYLNENQQYILKRKGRLTEGERLLRERANRLSLYLRDVEGQPRLVAASAMPQGWPDLGKVEADGIDATIAAALAARPELGLKDADIERARNDLALGQNALLPKVDLNLEAARDAGGGSITRQDTDAIVRLELAIPLERRQGRGKVAESRAKMAQLALERQLASDQIAVEIRNLSNDLLAAEQFVSLATQEVAQASLLARAEAERFANGASDFFLVNLREEAAADARLREVDAHLRYLLALADFHAATMRLEKFLIPDVPLDTAL